jgi:hypothetical protein
VDGQEVQALIGEVVEQVVQWQPLAPAATLVGGPLAGVIDEHPAHGPRGGGQKLGAALGGGQGVGAEDAQDGLVDQGGRLESLARLLVGEASGGELPEFVVDKREQLGCSLGVAGLGRDEDLGDVCHER